MIASPIFFIGLAVVTFVYCCIKALADFRERRWAFGVLGLLVALAAPATILTARYALEWWLAR